MGVGRSHRMGWVLLLAGMILAGCQGPHRISRGELKDIYYEMFLLDQSFREDPSLRQRADSLLAYAGIFADHGYDTDDYLYSVEYYLRDPERFAKLLKEVSERFSREAAQLKKEIDHDDWFRRMMAVYRPPLDSVLLPFSDSARYAGAARWVRDSLYNVYVLTGVQPDTTSAHETDSSEISLPAYADSTAR